jgi:hypothetical protein
VVDGNKAKEVKERAKEEKEREKHFKFKHALVFLFNDLLLWSDTHGGNQNSNHGDGGSGSDGGGSGGGGGGGDVLGCVSVRSAVSFCILFLPRLNCGADVSFVSTYHFCIGCVSDHSSHRFVLTVARLSCRSCRLSLTLDHCPSYSI